MTITVRECVARTCFETTLDLQAETGERNLNIGNDLELLGIGEGSFKQSKLVNEINTSNEPRDQQIGAFCTRRRRRIGVM